MRLSYNSPLDLKPFMKFQKYPFILLGCWFVLAILLILQSLHLSDWNLIYTLDDPYIHLAVAESILQGGYGINMGEYSAPSSSIIYPFLLAFFMRFGLGTWSALAVNLISMAAAVFVVGCIIRDFVNPPLERQEKPIYSKIFMIGLGLSVCLVLNSWGLVMTGMEHSLHVLLVVLLIRGFLVCLDESRKTPWWLIATIIALPLTRFEGLAMATISILALLYLKRQIAAIVTSSLLLFSLLTWFFYTKSLGLPALPSSVLLKSSIAANVEGQSGLAKILLSTLRNGYFNSLYLRQGCVLLISSIAVGILALQQYKVNRQAALVLGSIAVFSGVAHIFFGQFGWFSRYEIYAYATIVMVGLALGGAFLTNTARRMSVICLLLLISKPYAKTTLLSPSASQNIYQQQYQMHRFVVDYWKQPVAVNDLGWVSFNNSNYVLDLWGLGSEEIRRIKLAGQVSAKSLDAVVTRRSVKLMMIYDEWFIGLIPEGWRQVARLRTSQVTAGSGVVAFYITSSANKSEIIDLLQAFRATLPKGASLEINL